MESEERKPIIRKRRLEFEGDGYPGWWAEVRLNPPWGVMEDLFEAQDFKAVREGLGQVILDWNFVDDAGQALPPPGEDPLSLRRVPTDLVTALLRRYQQAATELPKE